MIVSGDVALKPCVTSEPEFLDVSLDGSEDFMVIASDGLWDFVPDRMIVEEIYQFAVNKPGMFFFKHMFFT